MEDYALILSDLFKEQYANHSSSGKIKIIEKINKLILEIIKEPRINKFYGFNFLLDQ